MKSIALANATWTSGVLHSTITPRIALVNLTGDLLEKTAKH